MNITNALTLIKKKVDANLSFFLVTKKPTLLLSEVKRMFAAGGKRTRAALAYYAYRAAGGNNEHIVVDLASAIELFHTFAIIHDDIIDHANIRRTVSSVNQNAGVPQAILVGDLALVLSVELCNRAIFSVDNKRRHAFIPIWERFMEDMLYGESLDVSLSNDTAPMTQENVEKKIWEMMELKTTRYSAVYPLQLGVALAGGSRHLLSMFADYGTAVGLAFQLHDDLLGMFGDEKTLGKPVDSDLKERKMTILMTKLHSRVANEGRWDDLNWVRMKLTALGIKKECEEIEEELVAKAKKTIMFSSLPQSSKSFFLDFADFIIKRQY